MESKENIALECVDSLICRAISEMNANDATAKKADIALSDIGDRIVGDSRLSGIERKTLNEYLTQLMQTTSDQFRYLYIQGAKDCVEALRKLGVIK